MKNKVKSVNDILQKKIPKIVKEYSEIELQEDVTEVLKYISSGLFLHDSIEIVKNDRLKKGFENTINNTNFWKYIRDVQDFKEMYARAQKDRCYPLFELLFKIIFNNENDLISGEFGLVPNRAAIDRHKLQVDTIKWIMSKLLPREFGEKLDIDHNIKKSVDVSSMSNEELEKRLINSITLEKQ